MIVGAVMAAYCILYGKLTCNFVTVPARLPVAFAIVHKSKPDRVISDSVSQKHACQRSEPMEELLTQSHFAPSAAKSNVQF
jgi:hypothetical protein